MKTEIQIFIKALENLFRWVNEPKIKNKMKPRNDKRI